jgi:hypothetical protein
VEKEKWREGEEEGRKEGRKKRRKERRRKGGRRRKPMTIKAEEIVGIHEEVNLG